MKLNNLNTIIKMSILQVSETQLNFEGNQFIKSVKLTNIPQTQGISQAVMFKIKTNKTDYVDAKPSCGYISGHLGDNQIIVSIRALQTKQFTAKLQILYIYHQKINDEIVEKNKLHFDLAQYTNFYQQLKKDAQKDVKMLLVTINRKATQQNNNSTPTHVQRLSEIKQSSSSEPYKSSKNQQQKKPHTVAVKIQKDKQSQNIKQNIKNVNVSSKTSRQGSSFLPFVLVLILGLLIGFYFGSKHNQTVDQILQSPRTANSQSIHEVQPIDQQIMMAQSSLALDKQPEFNAQLNVQSQRKDRTSIEPSIEGIITEEN